MIGVVADDITGANDIGIMFAKANLVVHVYSLEDALAQQLKQMNDAEKPDLLVLDTNSRLLSPQQAAAKVAEATRFLKESGAVLFINKTCSVFRGNIGSEFDAMLETLGEEFSVVVLGFPKNGRTTVDGIHYVHGKRLEESEFRNDPVHPMTESNLVDILQAQTKRIVDLAPYTIVNQGTEALKRYIQEKKSACSYLIIDVTDQQALQTIAAAVADETVLCGSSALAEELAYQLESRPRSVEKPVVEMAQDTGILCVAGSLMPQTVSQIKYMREQGTACYELDSLSMLDAAERKQEMDRLVHVLSSHLQQGAHAVIHSSNDPEKVAKTKQQGVEKGMSGAEIARLISSSLAEITAEVTSRTGQTRLIAAGGETSAAVCGRLGIKGLRIWKEIEPGLPSCISLSQPNLLLVLKSGSFGSVHFIQTALNHLLEQ